MGNINEMVLKDKKNLWLQPSLDGNYQWNGTKMKKIFECYHLRIGNINEMVLKYKKNLWLQPSLDRNYQWIGTKLKIKSLTATISGC